MKNKYELLPTFMKVTIPHTGESIVLRRIIALVDIPLHGVKAGERGGWIQSVANLSQNDSSWVRERGMVGQHGRVEQDALVDDGFIYDYAIIHGKTKIFGTSRVYGDSVVDGVAHITDSYISGQCQIKGNVSISNSEIEGQVVLEGDVKIKDSTLSGKSIHVREDVVIEHSKIYGTYIRLRGNANLFSCNIGMKRKCENLRIEDRAKLSGVTLDGGSVLLTEKKKFSGIGFFGDATVSLASFFGDNIIVRDYSVIDGYFTFGNNVIVREFATLRNRKTEEFFSSIAIDGETVISR